MRLWACLRCGRRTSWRNGEGYCAGCTDEMSVPRCPRCGARAYPSREGLWCIEAACGWEAAG